MEAAEAAGADFYAAYPLREWALVKRIQGFTRDGTCGELRSLRITWQRPRPLASDEKTFLFQTLPWLLDIGWEITGKPLLRLNVRLAGQGGGLFGLAVYEGGVVLEIEMNERLPDSMPPVMFIKANYTRGHLTNQPLVGHFNEEGSILADADGMRRIVVENAEMIGDELEIAKQRMAAAIEAGKWPKGPLHSREIMDIIRKALK
jgi:hypothetical protein